MGVEVIVLMGYLCGLVGRLMKGLTICESGFFRSPHPEYPGVVQERGKYLVDGPDLVDSGYLSYVVYCWSFLVFGMSLFKELLGSVFADGGLVESP